MFFRRKNHEPTVTIGTTGPWPLKRRVILAGSELQKHKHIIGTSDAGKSKFNALVATSLIMQGVPCSVIDPHADLVHDILGMLHQRGYFTRPFAYEKLWYLDFSRADRFLPFNVLAKPKKPYPSYSIQRAVRNLMEAIKRVFPSLDKGAAPQFENILQYTAVALAQNHLPITQAAQVLTDDDFRARLLANVTHEDTRSFFATRFDRWPVKDRTLNIESTLNKISIFTFTDPLKYALGHQDNLLDFRHILDEGIAVLINLHNLDSESRHLLGSLIMIGFEQATLSRGDVAESQRQEYHILVDEFPQFASRNEESFTTFLSEARKYKVRLMLSHQTGMQISERFHSALQNALPIIFRLGREDSLWAAEVIGSYDPYRVKHIVEDETAEERTHPVFWNMQEQKEETAKTLENLSR
jgi:hypothetical protein